jgi:competence protein ComEC
VIDRYAEPFGTLTWGGLSLAFCGLAIVLIRRPWIGAAFLLGAFVALSGARHHSQWSDLASDDLAQVARETPRPAWVRGVIVDVLGFRPGRVPDDRGVTRGVLEIVQVYNARGWCPASGSTMLTIGGECPDLRAGAVVEAAGGLALVARPLNPGEFDYQAYLRGQGIRLRLSVDDASGVWPDKSGAASGWAGLWPRMVGPVRAWSQKTLAGVFGPASAPLALALVLGRREGVDPDVNDAFARTGTTHLLAISGLHMQVLALALGFLLRACGLGRRKALLAVIAATIGYTVLVGFMPSVVRSAAMTATACIAGIFDRQNRNANTFALAAILTLAHNPSDLFDVGCQLSFLAVAAIVWMVGPVLARLRPRPDPLMEAERQLATGWRVWARPISLVLVEGVVVSTVVWLAALPLTALRFHLAAPISVALNLPLIPMTSVALLASGASLGMSAIWRPLGTPAAWVASWLLNWTEDIVRWGSAQGWGHVFVPEPSWQWVLGFYLFLGFATIAVVSRWGRPIRRGSLAALAIWIIGGSVGALAPRPAGLPRAEVLAVGHGLAVMIETGRGRAVLYDCGRMRDPSVGRRIIAPALWARGVRGLDAVILSHADADHYNGLPDLLDRVSIREVVVPEGFESESNPGAGELLQRVRSRRIPVRTVVAGECWETGATQFAIHHPPAGFNPKAPDNAKSLVLEVWSAGHRMILTGDLEGEGLLAYASDPGPRPDVFLAPHHGGQKSNPPWLYERTDPRAVVVSQRPPQPGATDALATLDRLGIPLLRTWQRGAVRFTWTESGIEAQGFLDRP